MRTTKDKLRQLDASEKKNLENIEAFVKEQQAADDGMEEQNDDQR